MDRRKFLAAAAAAGGAMALPNITFAQQKEVPKVRLFTLGREGRRYGSTDAFFDNGSVLTEINTATANVKQTYLPIFSGHTPTPLPEQGWIYCASQFGQRSALVDLDHKLVTTTTAPEGYIYSGHTLDLKDKGVVVTTLYKRVSAGLKDEGLLEVFDRTTFKLLDRVPTGGLQPHEMNLLPGGKEIALAQQGAIEDGTYDPNEGSRTFNVIDAKVTIVDVQTLKPVRHYRQKDVACPVHLTVGTDGMVYTVLQQYVPTTPTATRTKANIIANIRSAVGNRDWPLHTMELEGEGMALPLPLLKVNPTTGETTEIFTSAAQQRRSQSVITHSQSGQVFAIYLYTNNLLRVKPDGKVDAVLATSFNIHDLIGLTDIPGTPYLAAGGLYHGVSILDATTLQPALYVSLPLYRSSHLMVLPA